MPGISKIGGGGGSSTTISPIPTPTTTPIATPSLLTIKLPVALGGGTIQIDKFRAAEVGIAAFALYILGSFARAMSD